MPKVKVDGVARCSRYAFGPNRLHLCGPDANREVLAYVAAGQSDPGLTALLRRFATLYPYLKEIAAANHIADPFDDRVVEAYWIGNQLLEAIPQRTFYRHLKDTLRLGAATNQRSMTELANKLPQGARMHHSFHVFNVYKRTGYRPELHTLESMDACRVSWGKVVSIAGPTITVMRRPLQLLGHHLALGDEMEHKVMRQLDGSSLLDELRPGEWLTMHWGMPCEVVTERQVQALAHYTKVHLSLANLTL